MRRAAVIALLALVAAGCGGGEEVAPLPETVIGTVEKPTAAKGDPAAGKKVFESSGCGSCHTYDPAGAKGNVGPNLNELPALAKKANQGTLEEFVRTSVTNPTAYVEKGFQPGVMPPFTGSEKELNDLVAFLTQK